MKSKVTKAQRQKVIKWFNDKVRHFKQYGIVERKKGQRVDPALTPFWGNPTEPGAVFDEKCFDPEIVGKIVKGHMYDEHGFVIPAEAFVTRHNGWLIPCYRRAMTKKDDPSHGNYATCQSRWNFKAVKEQNMPPKLRWPLEIIVRKDGLWSIGGDINEMIRRICKRWPTVSKRKARQLLSEGCERLEQALEDGSDWSAIKTSWVMDQVAGVKRDFE